MSNKTPVMRRYEVTFDRFTAVIVAPSAGRAKSKYAYRLADSGWVDRAGAAFRSIRCRSLGPAGAEAAFVFGGTAFASEVDPKRDAERDADAWNAARPVGTPVRYWTGCREGDGKVSATRSRAQSMGSHASVWVYGEASCIALSHVEALRLGRAARRCAMDTRQDDSRTGRAGG